MVNPIDIKTEVIRRLVRNNIDRESSARILKVSKKTVSRYKKRFLLKGPDGLEDKRGGNNRKLTVKEKNEIVAVKTKDVWRSARNIRDKLSLPVHSKTVRRVILKAGLGKQNKKQVKALQAFEYPTPNDLWQTDIMGKILFPNIGVLYLIATLDDHSRFCLSGRWFKKQNKINVFQIWYEALSRFGLPKAMLQDEGSQYKAKLRFGEADYQGYAKSLGINLIWAKRAQCKGKIERFWRFVQDDFVREVLNVKTADEVNGAFKVWLAKYNYVFKSDYFGGVTRASRYQPSDRKLHHRELQHLLTIEERRTVTRFNTVSLYGVTYRIPAGYMKCRIWIKIVGNKLLFESMGKIFWKTRLRIK
jgi:transposase